jgi:hypothetical protein
VFAQWAVTNSRSRAFVRLPAVIQTTCGGGPCRCRRYEIDVLRDDDGVLSACYFEDFRIAGPEKPEILEVHGAEAVLCLEPVGERRWQLRVYQNDAARCRRGHSGGEHRVVQAPGGVPEDRSNVFTFEVGVVGDDLLRGLASREPIEDVDHPNAHAADARTTAALVGVDGDAIE